MEAAPRLSRAFGRVLTVSKVELDKRQARDKKKRRAKKTRTPPTC